MVKKSESNINFWADISKAKKLLGWEPKKDFKDGLDELKKEMGLE